PSNRNTSRPAACSDASARCGWPASSRPGSVTSSTRVSPSSRASSPRRFSVPAPKTTHVGAWKSKERGGQAAVPAGVGGGAGGRLHDVLGPLSVVRCPLFVAERMPAPISFYHGRRTTDNGQASNAEHALVELERPTPEQEVHNAALVRLQPVQLDRRDRPEV